MPEGTYIKIKDVYLEKGNISIFVKSLELHQLFLMTKSNKKNVRRMLEAASQTTDKYETGKEAVVLVS